MCSRLIGFCTSLSRRRTGQKCAQQSWLPEDARGGGGGGGGRQERKAFKKDCNVFEGKNLLPLPILQGLGGFLSFSAVLHRK